jgi:hypothetical protein
LDSLADTSSMASVSRAETPRPQRHALIHLAFSGVRRGD